MAFGEASPSVKNLLGKLVNEWAGQQTFTRPIQGVSPSYAQRYRNPTPAISGTQQASPTLEFEGQGFAASGGSRSVRFDKYVLPVQGTSIAAGILKERFSLNNAAFTDIFELGTTTDTDIPYSRTYGRVEGSLSNSSTLGTRRNFQLENPSGNVINLAFSFNNVIKSGISINSSGDTGFKTLASNGFLFYVGGSNVDSSFLIAQIFSGGFYNSLANYNGGAVTAGSADQGTTTTLSSYGTFAAKGVYVNAATYTIANETVIYGDASTANICSGTATACNTYLSSGACNAHTGAGCSWFSGSPCSDYSSTDASTCESGHPGCTWESQSCSGANNTDQSTCEQQDDSWGGSCSWDTSTCPSQSNQSSCEAITGCTWNSSNCNDFNGNESACTSTSGCTWDMGDCSTFNSNQSGCEGQPGCTWDGIDTCSGTYSLGTCSGQYNTSCSGNLCNGSYNTGACTGTWGAQCQGTASCGNLSSTNESTCEAESGCTWTTGATYTLPLHGFANRNNTSRFQWIKNVGASGIIGVVANTGSTLESSISLNPGEAVLLHHHLLTGQCSNFTTSVTCTPSGCSWTPFSCSGFGDETSCASASGCTWTGSQCEGTYSGTGGNCDGTYTVFNKWFKHAVL